MYQAGNRAGVEDLLSKGRVDFIFPADYRAGTDLEATVQNIIRKMAITDALTEENSRHAVTHVQVLAEYPGFSHIRCRLETGRTHQIRVHMAYMGHPVVGDPVYAPGRPDCGVQGQCLHAKKIGFIHPRTGEYMEFDSALPQYFTALLMKISKE